MVKARNGLIFSLLALVVALVVTTTSTYAWFAMNSQVTAQNMQISVTSDANYLVITNTLSEGKIAANASATTLNLTSENVSSVLPTRVKPTTSTNNTTLTWQTAIGAGYDSGAATGGNYTDLSTNLNKYVAEFTFYVGLNPAVSTASASNLRVKSLTLSTVSGDTNKVFFDALSVCVATSTGIDNYASAGHAANQQGVVSGNYDPNAENPTGALATSINKDGTPIQVHVYVYINGDNPNVKTANAIAANLGQYSVNVEFEVTPGTGA